MTPPFFLHTMKKLVVSIIMFLSLLYFVIQQCFQGQHHDVSKVNIMMLGVICFGEYQCSPVFMNDHPSVVNGNCNCDTSAAGLFRRGSKEIEG